MPFEDVVRDSAFILAEASVVESLRRSNRIELHPRLVNSPLIYDNKGREELSNLYNGFISVAQESGIPIVTLTPTWRANKERLSEAGVKCDVNKDAVGFMKEIRDKWGKWQNNIFIGGLTGCKNDCYEHAEALDMEEACSFHTW